MATDRPNVLVLLSDQHSHRYQGWLPADEGGEAVETPTLDDLHDAGTAFETAYCQSPLCTPSRACLWTGREVRESGGWDNGAMPRDHPTIPGAFSAAGYETCLVGKLHFGGDEQFRGFDHRPYGDIAGDAGHQGDPLFDGELFGARQALIPGGPESPYDLVPPRGELHNMVTQAGETDIPESLLQEETVVREGLSWLREHEHRSDDPWFLCASFSRPHWPRTAPSRHLDPLLESGVAAPRISEADGTRDHVLSDVMRTIHRYDDLEEADHQRARAGYRACVEYLDELLGEFLALLDRGGFLENTVVVYASDHGEMAGEHGLWGKATWHEASTRVPLVVQTPAQRAGDADAHRIETPVSLADLFPTLCGLADVEAPSDLDGSDLSQAVTGGAEPNRGPVVCDFFGATEAGAGASYRLVRDGQHKYVRFGDGEELFFDLAADPEERDPVDDPDGETAAALDSLRSSVERTMEFDTAIERKERDEERATRNRLGVHSGAGNAYHMPDGRIVEADTPLYQPHVVTRDPDAAFADWPHD